MDASPALGWHHPDHRKGVHLTVRSNAGAEGLNSRIQAIKVSARGYRNWEHFKTAIYFHLGEPTTLPRHTMTHGRPGRAAFSKHRMTSRGLRPRRVNGHWMCPRDGR